MAASFHTEMMVGAGLAQADRAKLVKDGYDGAEPSPNRQLRPVDQRPDHYVLSKVKRAAMNSAMIDAARNHSLTRWAIRQDQNWIADCRFEACSGDKNVDEQLEKIVEELQYPENFDLSARHGIHTHSRLIQAQRTLNGDVLILKCRDFPGGRIKTFSYDRLDHPSPPSKQWIQGVELEPFTDRVLRYAIRTRNVENGRIGDLWRVVDAQDAILHAYYELDAEAVRGASPLAPVINTITDIRESMTYAHAKVKLGQILGLVIKRHAKDSLARRFDEQGNEIPQQTKENWEWSLDSGPFQLDLDSNEEAVMLESKTPSQETMALIAQSCRESLKALDIPYCWWDGKQQNFFGSIGEMNLYKIASHPKRKTHHATLKEELRFIFQCRIAEGRLILPRDWTVDDCKCRLVPNGTPWFEPGKEVDAAAKAIAYGLSHPQLECEKIGTNFEENIAKTAEAVRMMLSHGLVPQFGTPPQEKIVVDTEIDPDANAEKREKEIDEQA